MYCNKCGSEVEKGAAFCQKCGADLREYVNSPIQNVPQKPTRKRKKWMIALIVVLVFAGGAGIALWQTGILTGRNNDIIRGYDKYTEAKDVWEEEKNKKDTKEGRGYNIQEIYNEEKEIYEYQENETDNPEEMEYIEYEGGNLYGIEADKIKMYIQDARLYTMDYYFDETDYESLEDKIQKYCGEYTSKEGDYEYWKMDEYSISFLHEDDYTRVRVVFLKF